MSSARRRRRGVRTALGFVHGGGSVASGPASPRTVAGIEDVAQPVGQQVEGDHRHRERGAGEGRHPPGLDEHVAAPRRSGSPSSASAAGCPGRGRRGTTRARIRLPTSSVAWISTGVKALGSRWRQRMANGCCPMARAASDELALLQAQDLRPGQPADPHPGRAAEEQPPAPPGPGWKRAARAIIRKSQGKASRASTPRMSTASIQPAAERRGGAHGDAQGEGQEHRDQRRRRARRGRRRACGRGGRGRSGRCRAGRRRRSATPPGVRFSTCARGQRLDAAEALDLQPVRGAPARSARRQAAVRQVDGRQRRPRRPVAGRRRIELLVRDRRERGGAPPGRGRPAGRSEPPPQSRAASASAVCASGIAHPRIDQRVEEVGQQVAEDRPGWRRARWRRGSAGSRG